MFIRSRLFEADVTTAERSVQVDNRVGSSYGSVVWSINAEHHSILRGLINF